MGLSADLSLAQNTYVQFKETFALKPLVGDHPFSTTAKGSEIISVVSHYEF
jgi:hypothetical protein